MEASWRMTWPIHLQRLLIRMVAIGSVKKAMDKNLVTCGLFLDFSKAFDTVNHNILLSELYHYGIRGTPFNYLNNRTQFVKIGNTKST